MPIYCWGEDLGLKGERIASLKMKHETVWDKENDLMKDTYKNFSEKFGRKLNASSKLIYHAFTFSSWHIPSKWWHLQTNLIAFLI